MSELAKQTVSVSHSTDVSTARREVRAMASAIGFSETETEEIALVVSELASNLVKHAYGGTVRLTPLSEGNRIGLEVAAEDRGPGIADVNQAFADGYTTTGGLGYGLGTVNRLMDELDIISHGSRGTRIVCRRWHREVTRDLIPCPLEFGVATRPRSTNAFNGDAFVIKRWSGSALVGVIDGLGHGQNASRAAQAARLYVETHYDQGLDVIFRGVERACHGTRGVVMALARFDFGPQVSQGGFDVTEIKLSFASVGNIEVRVFPLPPVRSNLAEQTQSSQPEEKKRQFNFMIRRGVIGSNAPKPLVTEHAWEFRHIMILHTDGLTSHWNWDSFSHLADKPASVIAAELLRALAKDDDATVAVVKGVTS